MPERLWRYLRFWGPDPAADLEDELRLHLESRIAEGVAAGLRYEDARAEALRRMGDLDAVRAACRGVDAKAARKRQRAELLRSAAMDVIFAVRQLARTPAVTLAVTFTLALGIGANTAIFSVVEALLLRPLPAVRAPEELVEMSSHGISVPTYRDLRASDAAFSGVAAFSARTFAVSDGARTELVKGSVVSANYFGVLGVRPQAGRAFGEGDASPSSPTVVVISPRLWRRFFAGDPAILGRTVQIGGVPATVVGIAPEGFQGTRLVPVPELWVPIESWPRVAPTALSRMSIEDRSWNWLTLLGRLKPGVGITQATQVLREQHRRLRELNPKSMGDRSNLQLKPALEAVVMVERGGVVRFVGMLMAAVAVVLLIACANLANLLLARAVARRRELSVRLALGATRGRLVRQLVTEAAVLSLPAGGAGLLLAWLALRSVERLPLMEAGALRVPMDGFVLAFALLLSLGTAALFGLLPALEASRPDVIGTLRNGSGTAGRMTSRARDVLVVTQVALSLVLLFGAGLLTRGLQRVLQVQTGMQLDGVALATADPGLAKYDTARAAAFYQRASAEVEAMPGVVAHAWATLVPLTGDADTTSVDFEGYDPAPGEEPEVDVVFVDPGYFSALGIAVLAGRELRAGDDNEVRGAVVTEALARRYWPGKDPVGRRLVLVKNTPATVVGVVRDVKVHSLTEEPLPVIFMPFGPRMPWRYPSEAQLVVRVRGNAAAMLPALERTLRTAAGDVPVFGAGTLHGRLRGLLAPQLVALALVGAFALVALVVAAVGVYAAVAFNVAQRGREIGIRVALGATRARVLRLVVGQSMARVLVGIAGGGILGAAAGAGARAFLHGISPGDPLTLAATGTGMLLVAAVAACVPVWRATRADPMAALRAD